MINDPIIQESLRAIKAIEELVNNGIKPWEPNAAYRAVRLFNELAKSYIDCMCEYVATRPKSFFPVAWCNRVEGLVPVGDAEDFLY